MESRESPRPGRHELTAFDPYAEGQRTVWMTTRLTDDIVRYQPRWRFYELRHNVPRTLTSPAAVFKGIRQHAEGADPDWGYCYVGDCDCGYDDKGSQRKPADGTIFAVYLNEDWHVFDWRWDASDDFNPKMPRGFASGRCGRLIWPLHS